jgi:hypothetical protein
MDDDIIIFFKAFACILLVMLCYICRIRQRQDMPLLEVDPVIHETI